VANSITGTRGVVVCASITIVVDGVAGLRGRREYLFAYNRTARITFRDAIRTNPWLAGIAGQTSTTALDPRHTRHQVGEVVVVPPVDIFPGEIELIIGNAAIVDEKMDLAGRVGIVLRLGIVHEPLPFFDPIQGGAAIAIRTSRTVVGVLRRGKEKSHLAPEVRRLTLQIKLDRLARSRIAVEHHVQIIKARLAPRHVIPTKNVAKHRGSTALNPKLHRTDRTKRLGLNVRVSYRIEPRQILRNTRILVPIMPKCRFTGSLLTLVTTVRILVARTWVADVADPRLLTNTREYRREPRGFSTITIHALHRNGLSIRLRHREGRRGNQQGEQKGRPGFHRKE